MNTIWKYDGSDHTQKRHSWRCARCGWEYVEVLDVAPPSYEIGDRYDGIKQPAVTCIPCKRGADALGEGGLEWLECVITKAITAALEKVRLG